MSGTKFIEVSKITETMFINKHERFGVSAMLLALLSIVGIAFLTMPVSATTSDFVITASVAPSFSAEIIPAGGTIAFPMVMGTNEKVSGICTINVQSNSPYTITALDAVQIGNVQGTNGRFKYLDGGSSPTGKALTNPLGVKMSGDASYIPLSTSATPTPVIIHSSNAESYSGNVAFSQTVVAQDEATSNGMLWMTVRLVASAT